MLLLIGMMNEVVLAKMSWSQGLILWEEGVCSVKCRYNLPTIFMCISENCVLMVAPKERSGGTLLIFKVILIVIESTPQPVKSTIILYTVFCGSGGDDSRTIQVKSVEYFSLGLETTN